MPSRFIFLDEELFDQCTDAGAGQAIGIQRANDCTDAGAGDQVWAYAQFIQGFQHGDMREPFGATAAQGQADARLAPWPPFVTTREQQRAGGKDQEIPA